MIRVFIVDDHPVVARGVAAHVAAEPGICVVGSAFDGVELLAAVTASAADVVVLDLQLPGVNGFELVAQLSAAGVAVVLFSLYGEGAMAREALAMGARWAVAKAAPLSTLTDAIRAVAAGERLVLEDQADALAGLSRRERQIFDRIVAGDPLKVIAADLGLSTGTVHTYAHRVRGKLGVETVPDLVRYAHRHGLHLRS